MDQYFKDQNSMKIRKTTPNQTITIHRVKNKNSTKKRKQYSILTYI